MVTHPHLCQIAFSVLDVARSHDFYDQVLGFVPAGGTESFRGPVASAVQGLPNAASTCWWLIDQREYMQLEMFQFESPPVRPLPDDWRPCDIGYSTVGLHLDNFDEALRRVEQAGTPLLSPAMGAAGERRVCIRDPDGVLLELMEDDPRPAGSSQRMRPDVPVVARSVTASVPDLDRARRFWVDTVGLSEASNVTLHGPEHEALWGLPGARRRTLLLWAGDFLIELVQYTDPVGRPWPDGYRISDQGILNVALGFRDKAKLTEMYQRVINAGYSSNTELVDLKDGGVVYCNDDQGFSLELMGGPPAFDEQIGFHPRRKGTLSDLADLG